MLKVKVEAPDDLNPQETSEWLEALDEIVDQLGPDRASYVLERLMEHASAAGVHVPLRWNTPYVNTIPPEEQVAVPGDRAIERSIKSLVRWNAIAMVVRANKHDANIGGHLATYAAAPAILYISRATLRPAFTRARFSKGGSAKSTWRISGTSCASIPVSRPIRIRG
jgi:pyruvate dehydrogenase E1 component